MRVLIACEWSGRVRDAFRRKGHDAYSCDRDEGEGEFSSYHIRGEVQEYLDKDWDMMLAFPPCTYLSTVTHIYRDSPQSEYALKFVRTLMDADIEHIAIENPMGVISSQIRKPDQIIHPWWFGEPYKKRTCLWLKNLPLLTRGENWEHPDLCSHWVNADSRTANTMHRDSKLRGKTFQGIANAMADQWGSLWP
jgi:site-specific DNA-cytosine methylase